jgi:NADH:ubiquinone oxidoreductase subunit 2 (subunit N)
MLIGFAAASIEAIEAVLIYILLYIPMLINMFGVILTMSKNKPEPVGNLMLEKNILTNPIIST